MDVTVIPRAGTGNKLPERRVFVREMSVLSAEGVKVNLIGHVYSGTRESAETSASSGMAPFVAILGLISICKRDNCSHMEAIDRRGQCNCFHREGGGGGGKAENPFCRNLSWHRKKQKSGRFRGRISFCAVVPLFLHLPVTAPAPPSKPTPATTHA